MKESGYIEYKEIGTDKVLACLPTHQCVHCGSHFTMKPAVLRIPLTPLEAYYKQVDGKKVRGFCTNCNGYICGPDCAACVPQEQMLENLERGRPIDFSPIVG